MKCPSCAADAADGSAECSACGVNFAKWRAKVEKQAADAAVAAEAAILNPPSAPGSTLKTTLGVMAVLCLAVFGAYAVAHRAVEPDLEDVYFCTLAGLVGPAGRAPAPGGAR